MRLREMTLLCLVYETVVPPANGPAARTCALAAIVPNVGGVSIRCFSASPGPPRGRRRAAAPVAPLRHGSGARLKLFRVLRRRPARRVTCPAPRGGWLGRARLLAMYEHHVLND